MSGGGFGTAYLLNKLILFSYAFCQMELPESPHLNWIKNVIQNGVHNYGSEII